MAPLFTLPAAPPPLFDLPTVAVHSSTGQQHTVRSGETVYGLALKYGTSTSAIARANNLANSRMIHPGDVLVIPPAEQGTVKRPARSSSGHTVAAGETLSGVASRYGTTIAAIAKANGISPSRFIQPGQKVRISYDAFPYQRFGQYEGTVRSISQTDVPVQPSPNGDRRAVFMVRVTLASDQVKAYGTEITLRPGHTLTADIELDRRKLFRWMLDPLFAFSGKL